MADVDVAVAGGGPAGFAAAVAAAREGAKTLIVEATGCLGGQGTGGLVGPFMSTLGTEGIYDEVRKRLKDRGALQNETRFDAEILKGVLQDLVEEAGARQLLFAVVGDALQDEDRVTGFLAVTKGGLGAVRAKVTVDCTGDGDVAAFAGAGFEKGREDGRLQCSTLFFNIAGVDEREFQAGWEEYSRHCREYAKREREAGRLHLPNHTVPGMVWKGSTLAPAEYSVNLDTAVQVDGTEPWQLSDAMNSSRRMVFESVEFFRKYLPGGANCRVSKTGALFGIRETRRFRGLERVTGQDVVSGRKRSDAICRASFYLDLHDAEMEHDTNMRNKYGRLTPPEGDWYEIPYGCMVPVKKDGLLVAGRCVSSDRDANGSLRIMPTCMALGQAAGAAAALCAREGLQPRQVPVRRLQEILRSRYGLVLAG